MTNAVTIAQQGSNNTTFRNRIINGAMVIDQRNAGASVSVQTTTNYTLDRWAVLVAANSKCTVQQNAGSITPPTGFSKYLGVTVGASANVTVGATDQYLLRQGIEGFNMADLAWGTASAASITISFWVRSSLTGTFGGSLNGGGGGSSYSYPFTYTISSANTWEQKTITISGQTAGTWTTDNTLFTWVGFDLGVGSTYSGTAGAWANTYYSGVTGAVKIIQTNSATFYITGVQLEAGTTASPFEYRLYGTELALCQRYYESTAYPDVTFSISAIRVGVCLVGVTTSSSGFNFLVPKRTNSPTVTLYSRNNNSGKVSLVTSGADVSGTSTASSLNGTGFSRVDMGAAQTGGAGIEVGWTASAEL